MEECPICYNDIEVNQLLQPCHIQHKFCINCFTIIHNYLIQFNRPMQCPFCRININNEFIQNIIGQNNNIDNIENIDNIDEIQPNIIIEQNDVNEEPHHVGIFVFQDNIPDGPYSLYSNNGIKLEESNYLNGLRHGLLTLWCQNGIKVEESNYLNGLRHGLLTLWCQNGIKVMECNYENGLKNGICKIWNQDGLFIEEINYLNDVIVH